MSLKTPIISPTFPRILQKSSLTLLIWPFGYRVTKREEFPEASRNPFSHRQWQMELFPESSEQTAPSPKTYVLNLLDEMELLPGLCSVAVQSRKSRNPHRSGGGPGGWWTYKVQDFDTRDRPAFCISFRKHFCSENKTLPVLCHRWLFKTTISS